MHDENHDRRKIAWQMRDATRWTVTIASPSRAAQLAMLLDLMVDARHPEFFYAATTTNAGDHEQPFICTIGRN